MPPSDDDHALLHRYAARRCEDSFRQLVARHLDLVYSAAFRQTHATHHAQEIAQSVFIELSRSAARIRRDLPLTAWLYTVTRLDLIRRESARQAREHSAFEQNLIVHTTDSSSANNTSDDAAAWSRLTGALDEAMMTLGEKDRSALLLRFFANRPLREIGAQLGISDDAAQKRIARSLERLRENFTRRGFTLGAGTLGSALSAQAVHTAPFALSATISAAALLAPPAAATALSALLAMTSLQKITLTALIASTAGLGFFGTHAAHQRRELSQLREQLQQTQRTQIDTEQKLARAEKELTASDVTLARADEALTNLTSGPDASLNAEVYAWTKRVHQLRAWASRPPERTIPEMSLLTDSDWLQASREAKLANEDEARQALFDLRVLAKNKFMPLLLAAIEDYKKAHHGALPTDIQSLSSYFKTPLDPGILSRYHVVPANPENPRLPSQLIVENGRVDEDYDTIFDVQRAGGWGRHSSSKFQDNMKTALEGYRRANNGAAPADLEKLLLHYPDTPSEKDLARIQEIVAQQTR